MSASILSSLCALGLLLAAPAARAAAPADELAQAVALAVQADLPPELTVMSVVPSTNLRLPRRAELALSWAQPPRRGPGTVAVTVRQGRRTVAQGWARVELAELRPVPVLREARPRGHRLAAHDLEFVTRPAIGPAPPTPAAEELVGGTLTRDAEAGAVLSRQLVTPAPPVPRGSAVRIVLRRGAVIITATGALERPARLGTVAAVRLDDGTRLQGRLVDEHTVHLGEEP